MFWQWLICYQFRYKTQTARYYKREEADGNYHAEMSFLNHLLHTAGFFFLTNNFGYLGRGILSLAQKQIFNFDKNTAYVGAYYFCHLRAFNGIYFWRKLQEFALNWKKWLQMGKHTVLLGAKSTFSPRTFVSHWVQIAHSSFSRATSMIGAVKNGGTLN